MDELAEVYARSLFDVAREHDKLDELREQLSQFADALDSNRQLAVFFFSPYFSTKEKQDALGRILQDADELLVNFLKLLIENHRMPVIFRARQQFEQMWERANKLLPVDITSAVELDAGDDREPRPAHRRARRAQGAPGRARRPGHHRGHRAESG